LNFDWPPANASMTALGWRQPGGGWAPSTKDLSTLWRETLRYRKNYAYLYEVTQVREAAEWLLVNSNHL
jgi:hypothetical protein